MTCKETLQFRPEDTTPQKRLRARTNTTVQVAILRHPCKLMV